MKDTYPIQLFGVVETKQQKSWSALLLKPELEPHQQQSSRAEQHSRADNSSRAAAAACATQSSRVSPSEEDTDSLWTTRLLLASLLTPSLTRNHLVERVSHPADVCLSSHKQQVGLTAAAAALLRNVK